MVKKIGIFLFFALVGSLWAAEDYAQWQFYRNISINTLGITSTVILNFPILIRLNGALGSGTQDSLVFINSQSAGQDLRLSDTTGSVPYSYQIERWDNGNRLAEIWVLIPNTAANGTTKFRMYWGNPTVSAASNGAEVFSSSNYFTGVWHLSEESSGKGSSGLYKDAVGLHNGDDSIANTSIDGIVGKGHAFTKDSVYSGDYIPLRSNVMSFTANPYTVSCWVKVVSGATVGGAIMTNERSEWDRGATCFYFGDNLTGSPSNGLYPQVVSFGNSFLISSQPITTGVWHHLAFTHGTTTQSGKIYIDGDTVPIKDNSLSNGWADSATYSPRIGNGNGKGSEARLTFNGSMDEFEISNSIHSASWIKLCYESQKVGATIVNLSSAIPLHLPSNLTYTKNSMIIKSGSTITPDTAKWTGWVDSLTVSPALPVGLAIAKSTGIISGTASGLALSGAYVVTARNSVGSTTFSVNITVYVQPLITQQPVSRTVTMGSQAMFFIKDSGTALSFLWTGNSGPINGNPPPNDTLKFTADTALDNWIYRCRIKNTYGDSVWSLPCTLHVQVPPTVTNPLSRTVADSSNVTFTVQAKGRPFPTFAWFRNATAIAGATSASLTLNSIHSADDKATFKCVATNTAGSASSALCTLRVVSANFGATPRTGFDSMTVTFTDSSTGGVSQYKWEFGDGDSSMVAGPVHTYKTPGKYTVKQTVTEAGIIESALKTDFITVNYSKPRPQFMADTLQGVDSLLVHFQDFSKGVVTSREWTFGDGGSDTGVHPAHQYKDTGSFTVRLIVSGPGGTDSLIAANYIFIYSKSDNPARIKGRRLSASSVEITFSNYAPIPTSATTASKPPYADTIGLWFKQGSMPVSPLTDSLLKKYSLIQMQNIVAAGYKDTVKVPLCPPWAAEYYGFNTALYWNDRSKSPMKPGNGDSLLMQDTVRPGNPLTITGAYLGGDSAAIYVGNISGLDSAADSLMGIWYGFRDSTDFADGAHTRWYGIGAAAAKAIGNRLTYVFHEPLKFTAGDTVRVFAAVALLGRNRLQSAPADTSFIAVRLRPENPVRLHAKAKNPTSILLSWKDMTTGKALTGVDSLVIWFGAKAVPALNPSAPSFTALRPAIGDTAFLKSQLSEKTRYYFGAQIYRNGEWSAVTDSASAGDSTPAILDTARPINTITNVSLRFDTTQNRIMVQWRIEPADTSEDVGIAYSLKGYPTDTSSPPRQAVRVTASTDSAALTIDGPLVFDSTYYVSLWLRRNGGKWAPPSGSSVADIHLPAFVPWQTITYFTKYPDTVVAFGGRVRLANDPGNETSTTDKLIYDNTLTDSLNGFVPVSIGFYFQKKIASAPFHIGVAYDTAKVPRGFVERDIRMYRRDSAGSWLVDRGTVIDTARGYAWVLTRNLDFPFIAMIDTQPPRITVKSSTTGPVVGGVSVFDTFEIRDNVANMNWSYRFAKGEDSYAVGDSVTGISRSAAEVVYASIPGVKVNQNNGTRAVLIVDDGANWQTADVSRQVYCDSALNVVKTTSKAWYPLQVTTALDSQSAPYVLRNLSKPGEEWYYDNTKFRLFRWYSYDGNADSAQKWVEYSAKTNLIFTFEPGKLFWIKTRVAATINLGKSVTPSLREPSTIVLAGKALTDFSLPLGFDVTLGDVLASTEADTAENRGISADSLQIHRFIADSTGQYRSEPFYLGRFAGVEPKLADKTDTMRAKTGSGYCIYNPYSTPVLLKVPPLPVSMSKSHGAAVKKAKTADAWALAVAGQTAEGMRLSTVYCGHAEGKMAKSYYPTLPMMGGVGIRVCDEAHRQYGHAISRSISSKVGGETYILAICNESGVVQRIVYSVGDAEALPRSMKAEITDPATGSFEDARTPQSLTIADGAVAYRHLIVGTDAYRAKIKKGLLAFRLALAGAYPNPFIRSLKIRFNLPESGLGSVHFSIVNITGRKVWERTIGCGGGVYGAQELTWEGKTRSGSPIAAGIYVLRMAAMDARGKSIAVFEKKITAMPQ